MGLGRLLARRRPALALAGGGDEDLHRPRLLRDGGGGEGRQARAIVADFAHVGTDTGGDAERGAEGQREARGAKYHRSGAPRRRVPQYEPLSFCYL